MRDLPPDQTFGRLASDILPSYLMERRWYAAKDAGVPHVGIANSISLAPGDDAVILILDVTPERQPSRQSMLPVSILWDAEAPASAILAEVQHASSRGLLVDAFADDRFIRGVLARIATDEGAAGGDAPVLVFRRSASLNARGMTAASTIERRAGEQSNTSVRIGGLMLKGFRRLEGGIHPELEIGRFLTEVAGFKNAPALLGSVELAATAGEAPTALCVLQALIPNQGDGWSHVIERLESITDEHADWFSHQFNLVLGNVERIIRESELPALSADSRKFFASTSAQIQATGAQIEQMTTDLEGALGAQGTLVTFVDEARTAIKSADLPATNQSARTAAEQTTLAADDLRRSLPAIRDSLEQLRDLARQLQEQPESMVYGPRPPVVKR